MAHDHSLDRPAQNAASLRLTVTMLAALAVCVPAGDSRAEKLSPPLDTTGMASAIERGNVTVQEGVVSWYGAQFHDRQTASGERFDSGAFTMAHRSLPFGTMVRVTNLRNGRSVVVRVNDRGPFVGKRIADLSQAAASEIGMMSKGVARARIEVLAESVDSAG